jgi:hypothetical protein
MTEYTERYISVPAISLHTDELYIYSRKEWISAPNYSHKKSLLNLKDNKKKVEISNKSKQKIKKAAKYLLYNSVLKTAYNHKTKSRFSFKVNFITLTLSSKQIHSDKEIKSKLLNQFLVEAHKKWQVKNYIWRAEKQKNGNIHFHILCDRFIPWLELRNVWNRIQNKLGYIDAFEAMNKNRNPNSTDIHSLRKVKNVAAYVTKYITKNEGGSVVTGENWRSSKELSNIKGARIDLTDEILNEIENLQNTPNSRRLDKEHFSAIFFDPNRLTQKEFPYLFTLFHNYITELFGAHQIEIFNDQ